MRTDRDPVWNPPDTRCTFTPVPRTVDETAQLASSAVWEPAFTTRTRRIESVSAVTLTDAASLLTTVPLVGPFCAGAGEASAARQAASKIAVRVIG
jgi:hypothetical protein